MEHLQTESDQQLCARAQALIIEEKRAMMRWNPTQQKLIEVIRALLQPTRKRHGKLKEVIAAVAVLLNRTSEISDEDLETVEKVISRTHWAQAREALGSLKTDDSELFRITTAIAEISAIMYRRHYGFILNRARSLAGEYRIEAEDIVGETAVRVRTAIELYRPDAKAKFISALNYHIFAVAQALKQGSSPVHLTSRTYRIQKQLSDYQAENPDATVDEALSVLGIDETTFAAMRSTKLSFEALSEEGIEFEGDGDGETFAAEIDGKVAMRRINALLAERNRDEMIAMAIMLPSEVENELTFNSISVEAAHERLVARSAETLAEAVRSGQLAGQFLEKSS